jgi:hypothetical protein
MQLRRVLRMNAAARHRCSFFDSATAASRELGPRLRPCTMFHDVVVATRCDVSASKFRQLIGQLSTSCHSSSVRGYSKQRLAMGQ